MAKRIITENYTFVPGTGLVTINGKAIRREQLVLITNVTTNTVIYNFADSNLTASSYTVTTTNNVETTIIDLTYNTSSMSSTDKLAILVDETSESFYPSEAYKDAVEKFRVSTPQALIDTDFEYGVQSTKWETIALMNNRPAAFYDPTQGISDVSDTRTLPDTAPGTYRMSAAAGNGTRTVTLTLTNTAGLTTATPIFVQDTTDSNANGWFLVASVTANTNITYIARGNVTNGSIFDTTKTYLFVGRFYTGAAVPASTSALTYSGTSITAITTNAHGFSPGQAVYIANTTATTNPPNGAWFIKTVPTSNTFTFDVISGPTGTISSAGNSSIFPRTWGSSIHRAFDGGVTFSAGYPYHGNQLIRQTRRYFRYQSGKGLQFSTGSNMCSPFQVDSMTASGSTVTVTTKFPHNQGVGAVIKVSAADQAAYNGTFTILTTPTDTTFTYSAGSTPSASPATCTVSSTFNVQPFQWYGASIRIGMFDSQNGMFFEYDGQTLYCVRRNSTNQLQGVITSLTNGQQSVGGSGTVFSQVLIPGDFVSIRGMTYTVLSIESDTAMTIYPDYRGTTITSPSRVVINKVIDLRIPQSQWNMDKMDGTGASAFNVDITKMQMWFMDYAWYGAGTVRWGLRNQRGEIIYCHRLAHGNLMNEAYLRSGNLPARYEVNTFYPKTVLAATLGSGETGTLSVRDTTGFPSSGTVIVSNHGNTGAVKEAISYTGKTATTFTGLSRGLTNLTGPGGQTGMGCQSTGQTFTTSTTTLQSVEFWGPQSATTISHWGSSVMMDGRYDDDKAILFNFGITTPITYAAAGTRFPVFSIRLSPSVDSGLTGLLGQRELVNRMQLQPIGMGVFTTTAAVRVELFLNARVSGGTFIPVGGSSLAQVATHANNQTVAGGESIFTFFAPAGGVSSQDLSRLRDIGNSILGGGTTTSYPTTDGNKYPDGPDTLTITVTPLAANAVAAARMNWSEAQA